MKNSKSNTSVLQALKGKDFHVDALGRIIIDDPAVLDAMTGGIGSLSEIPDPFWNGACSNQHC